MYNIKFKNLASTQSVISLYINQYSFLEEWEKNILKKIGLTILLKIAIKYLKTFKIRCINSLG